MAEARARAAREVMMQKRIQQLAQENAAAAFNSASSNSVGDGVKSVESEK